MLEKLIVLAIFVACYSLAISRKVRLAYVSLGAAALLLILGLVSPVWAFTVALKWDVLAIYWGFAMISMAFARSGMPELIAHRLIRHAEQEKYVIFTLCVVSAVLSAFMENAGVVMMMAPLAIAVAKKLKGNLFSYIIAIAMSANVMTTVTLISDTPTVAAAVSTGMKFLDFYWMDGRLGLGVINIIGASAGLLSLLFIFRKNKKIVYLPYQKMSVDWIPTAIFMCGIVALAAAPYMGVNQAYIGLAAGIAALVSVGKKALPMARDFDWNSFFFIAGIFIVISSLEVTGLTSDFAGALGSMGMSSPLLALAVVVWFSAVASSFMEHTAFTVLMIPVCTEIAAMMGMNAFPLIFGMLLGMGIGGNLTPVGSSANIFACGVLEKQGVKVSLKEYMKISVPFSLISLAVSHVVLQLLWL